MFCFLYWSLPLRFNFYILLRPGHISRTTVYLVVFATDFHFWFRLFISPDDICYGLSHCIRTLIYSYFPPSSGLMLGTAAGSWYRLFSKRCLGSHSNSFIVFSHSFFPSFLILFLTLFSFYKSLLPFPPAFPAVKFPPFGPFIDGRVTCITMERFGIFAFFLFFFSSPPPLLFCFSFLAPFPVFPFTYELQTMEGVTDRFTGGEWLLVYYAQETCLGAIRPRSASLSFYNLFYSTPNQAVG